MKYRNGDLVFAGDAADEGGVASNSGSASFFYNKRKARKAERTVPSVMRGLKAVVEERERRREEENPAAEEIKSTSSDQVPAAPERTIPDPPQ